MKVETKYFGDVEFDEKDIISFPSGILGFEEFNRYILIRFDSDNKMMFCLQGIDSGAPVFIVFNPFEIDSEYEPVMAENDLSEIECTDANTAEYYVIGRITQPMESSVVNMRSPIAVNPEKKMAKQIVMDKYDLRYPIFKKTEE